MSQLVDYYPTTKKENLKTFTIDTFSIRLGALFLQYLLRNNIMKTF